jgi:hypothetical protein
LLTHETISNDDETLDLPNPDEPPLEYIYLDSARVLAYLGQVEQGLATTETRTFTEKRLGSAGLKGDNVVEVSASVERQRQTQQVVTQTEADRFFTFLRILRREGNRRALFDIEAQLTESNNFEALRRRLGELHEGDFIRIRGAYLSLPSFAAVFSHVRYVPYYDAGRLHEPPRPLFAPMSEREREDVIAYRSQLGDNPRLPFIVPTIETTRPRGPEGEAETGAAVTFVVPVRYAGLTTESGLLAGAVTIVGKVAYKDERLPSEVPKDDPTAGSFVDRQSLASFGHALRQAPASLLNDLKIPKAQIASHVEDELSIPTPVVLVVPLAIYQ